MDEAKKNVNARIEIPTKKTCHIKSVKTTKFVKLINGQTPWGY